jgi:hypothetical protein
MSIENTLKERLSYIVENDYRVSDEAKVWPLAMQMMQYMGSLDPQSRDRLIWETLSHWAELYFDSEQLGILLNIALDDEHLYYGLGEQDTDSVFMRSNASLTIASFLETHQTRPFLTAQAIEETLHKMLSYLPQERDLRGFVGEKGWAHAIAHAGDALNPLAMYPELGKENLLDMLRVIRKTIVSAPTVFADEEDERLANPVLSAVQRQVLTQADIAEWISSLASFELPPTWPEWVRKKTNIKHFLRSLYFRSRYQGMSEPFEPALGETLQEISERRIPATYF